MRNSLRLASLALLCAPGVCSVLNTTSPTLSQDAKAFSKDTFDFIVVGGGTSGLVVAARLSENPSVRVGVLEAGRYLPGDPNIDVPQGTGYLGNPLYDWGFTSTPQSAVNGRSIYLARGKMVGGSSAINSMIWQRGSRVEYDLWNSAFKNGPSWTFDRLLPFFKKVESWSPPSIAFPSNPSIKDLQKEHGLTGPVHISYPSYLTDIDRPSVETVENMGLTNPNPDGGNATGFPLVARTVDPVSGTRSYAATAYYAPNAKRPNLVMLTEAQATKILFKRTRGRLSATGVQYIAGGKTYSVIARKELILAGGSLQTPQLLELSGVGNKTLLSKLGIETVLDLPQVGENLQDHAVCLSDFKARSTTLTLDQLRINSTFLNEQQLQYNRSRIGALTYTPDILGPTPLQRLVSPSKFGQLIDELDARLAKISLTPLQKVQYAAQRKLLLEGQVGWVEFVMLPGGGYVSAPAGNTSYVTAVAVNLHPFGRGSVHINTTNPLAYPLIDPKFLDFEFDAHALVQGSQFIRRWTQTKPLADLIDGPNSPPSTVKSDAEFASYMRSTLQTTNHPLGTTAMASRDLGGVVSSRLKIYGLENVRIVDAGIIPMSLGVAILSTVYAVAEKAADMIKEDFNL